MDSLKHYTHDEIRSFVNIRPGEDKIGAHIASLSSLDELANCTAKYVLLGIPEDIGVRANHGIGGAASVWEPALKAILNIQRNEFFSGSEMAVLGYFDIAEPHDASVAALRSKVNELDKLVAPVLQKVFAAGKTPIIIGGGHNNAFPILAAHFMAQNRKCNAVNIDAHADIRPVEEGRHSGNGFSAAMQQGCLDRYGIFGLHQSYNNAYTLQTIARANGAISTSFFDDILLSPISVDQQFEDFITPIPEPCGLEVDLDSIQNILSSAATPSGFLLNDIRKIVMQTKNKFSYLHICEGAVALKDGRTDASTAKAIAYLVSDFVK